MWLLKLEPTNAHNLLKSQYYSSQVPACFGPHWFIIREHTVVQNSYLTFSACSCEKLFTVWYLCVCSSCALTTVTGAACVLGSTVLKYCFVQSCAPWWWTCEARNMQELTCCNTDPLIKLDAFVSSNCNSWVVMHGMEIMWSTEFALFTWQQKWSACHETIRSL